MKFAIVNHDPSVADQLTPWAAALERQLREHVAPSRGLDPSRMSVEVFASETDAPATACLMGVFVDGAQAGSLAWHALSPGGRPYGRIFTGACRSDGVSIPSAMSHEIIEAQCDAHCNLWCDRVSAPEELAHEACDAVQADTYTIDGVEVSDFVLPGYFNPTPPTGAKFDYLGKLDAPFSMSPGGYTLVRTAGVVSQRFADGRELGFADLPEHKRHPAARTARRFAVTA